MVGTVLSIVAVILVAGLTIPQLTFAAAIVPGFNANTLARNDDGSTGLVSLGFTANFFGTDYTQLYVNNNGNVTFNSALSTFTPFNLTGATGNPIMAPFFADVDTRGTSDGSLPVTYGTGTLGSRSAFGVNWVNVGYFASHTDKLNSFQLVLVDRGDTGAGNFDFYYNYDQIQWETGDASGGSSGFGGTVARVGYNSGTGTFLEFLGSGVTTYFLDSSLTGLIHGSLNSNILGQYAFQVRNGEVVPSDETPIPEPGTMMLLGSGLVGLAGFGRKRFLKK